MKFKLLALIPAILFISAKGGCNKEDQQRAEGLTGEWKWVKTFCCGRTSKWTDPSTCTCTKMIVFTKDGKYSKYNDGALVKQGTFSLRKGLNDYQQSTGDNREAIIFDNDDAAYIIMENDTMGITMGYMDGPNDY